MHQQDPPFLHSTAVHRNLTEMSGKKVICASIKKKITRTVKKQN